MANDEHLRILKQGAHTWNKWREDHPDIKADLREANLTRADLREVNFTATDLYDAVLRWADLTESDLRFAAIHGADFSYAKLRGAKLGTPDGSIEPMLGPTVNGVKVGPKLNGVDMRGADLSGADLTGLYINASLSGMDVPHFNAIGDLTASDSNSIRRSIAQGYSAANLSGANLTRAQMDGAFLSEVNLSGANMGSANLSEADLRGADIRGANLIGANLSGADLRGADIGGADLIGADLSGANLSGTDLMGANLSQAILERSILIETNLQDAILTGCRIYGISAWELNLTGAFQSDLTITREGEPIITVDSLEVGQFIYLLLNNEKIRDVIDTITSKVVLILGRFAPERKAILDALRQTLRQRNYLPVLFDFDKPASRDLTETVRTLAHLARFIIADITDPKSIPQELQAIVPDLAVPVQPIIETPQRPWGMFVDFPKKYHWVLAVHEYNDVDDLLTALETKVIALAESKAKELMAR